AGENLVEVGMRQTPIDIDNKLTTKTDTAALTFQYEDAPMAVTNTGHVVEVEYPAGSTIRLGQFSSSGAMNWSQASDEYQLVQFHFHAPSEHTIDGKRAAMEAHLVHRNQLGDLAVVGVLMNLAQDSALLVDSIIKLAPLTVGEGKQEGVTLNARRLIPENKSYYMYSGSLTTPPCTEGVRWFVMRDPIAVSPQAVHQMHNIVSHFPGYEGFADNNRPIVLSHGRTVIVNRQ
ncbi:MAG: carbonic anhydrase family protein, partial [Bryobacteraceae bacterium]